MTNAAQLASRFKEVLLNGKWIANTNYKDQLENTTRQEANYEIVSLNSLVALAFHINYYIDGILNVFEGGLLEIQDKYSFDAPEITSQEEWNRMLNDMWTNAEQFTQHIEGMSDDQLQEDFVKPADGTYHRNIEGD